MTESKQLWFKLDKDDRKQVIVKSLNKGLSWSQMSDLLLNDKQKKSTIWAWAQRNLEPEELNPDRDFQDLMEFTDDKMFIMYDIINSLFPRLDASMDNLFDELKRLQDDQKDKFFKTGWILDQIEETLSKKLETMIQKAMSGFKPTVVVQGGGYPSGGSVPPLPPGGGMAPPPPPSAGGAPPPPPPPGGSVTMGGASPMAALRTDFENMSMEEIKAIPSEHLQTLSTIDRGKLQERVKELKRIAKMSPEEREEYLRKKEEEKVKSEAMEGLGGALSSMLDDDNSLFARMKKAADDSQIAGSGTFGAFTTDFVYGYCFSCGKNNRAEDEAPTECAYCGAGEEYIISDEEKVNYKFYECSDCKIKETVDPSFKRGSPIVILSRWKAKNDEKVDKHSCGSDNIRDITSNILVSQDPDKEFAYFLVLLRLYSQSDLRGDLKSHVTDLMNLIQRVPDITKKEQGLSLIKEVLNTIKLIIKWIENKDNVSIDSESLLKELENFKLDIQELEDSDSPKHYLKMNETGQITGRINQLMTRFMGNIFTALEKFLFVKDWHCGTCNEKFTVAGRNIIPEKCAKCGAIISTIEPTG